MITRFQTFLSPTLLKHLQLRLLLVIFIFSAFYQPAFSAELSVLTYHDVVPNPGKDYYAVSRSQFVAQMDYLENNGYRPISISFLEKVINENEVLPNKAILLTFDDGLNSYHDFVVPLLEIYGYPSVSSIVTSWADNKNTPEEYQGKLMNWQHLKSLTKKPLVEIISHTHDLHHGIQSNPQGNTEAASITRKYLPVLRAYETEEQFRRRIHLDLQNSKIRIESELGFVPKAVAWPYGYYDETVVEEASKLGMEFQLTLDEGPTNTDKMPLLNRLMVVRDTGIPAFERDLLFKPSLDSQKRFVEISLSPFIGLDEQEKDEILSNLLDRLKHLSVNMVVISPFTEDKKQAFFPNDQIPLATDILNRASHQIRSRLNIPYVYLRIPENVEGKDFVKLYTDLARLNWFNGLVFDKGIDEENAGHIKQIVKYYRPEAKFGISGKPENPELYDFVYLKMEPDPDYKIILDQIAKVKGLPLQVYVSFNWTNNSLESSLVKSMKMIRTSGIKHFGYSPDDYLDGIPNYQDVKPELTAKTSLAQGG